MEKKDRRSGTELVYYVTYLLIVWCAVYKGLRFHLQSVMTKNIRKTLKS